jgi:diphthine-ammonia ligase
MSKQAVVSWSGGKDSCYAAIQAAQQGISPTVLLNVLNEAGKISRSHGIPVDILDAQAAAIGLPIHLVSSSWKDYEATFVAALQQLQQSHELTHAVFGDIDLQAHRDWEEMVCDKAALTAVLPLWLRDRKQLVLEMLDQGIETMIVSCNTTMGEKYLGKTITQELVEELEALGIDPCGENGEYHTLVTNCSLFEHPIQVQVVNTLLHDNYWFTELRLA